MSKSMGKMLVGVVALMVGAGMTGTALAKAERATKQEAMAMVHKGVAYIKKHGTAAGYAEITKKANMFHDRDLYLVVYGLDGIVRAHGQNPKMVGKNLIALRDVDGKPFVKERVELGKTHETFWQDYKFTDPKTRRILPKEMFCERLGDTVVCGGVYKP